MERWGLKPGVPPGLKFGCGLLGSESCESFSPRKHDQGCALLFCKLLT